MPTSIHDSIKENWLTDEQEYKLSHKDDNPTTFPEHELIVRSNDFGRIFLSKVQLDGSLKDYHTLEDLEEDGYTTAYITFGIQLLPKE